MRAKGDHYRGDVDGLRAVAVLAVIFFHLEFSGFSGGYVGVDVFFVVSGFLITRLIRDEIDDKRFAFSNFYVRRLRRLFPALLFTGAATFLAALVLYPPTLLKPAAGSLAATIASVSNFYFWRTSGYFETAAELQPLLHTWSLSVEEQFYLAWPASLAVLLALAPRRAAPIVLVIAGLASLALAEAFRAKAEAIFYLAPFRGFEFAIGALLVWIKPGPATPRWMLETLGAAGLAAVIAATALFDAATPFPGRWALLPCLGAAAVVYAGTGALTGRVLNLRPVVAVGLISYSLYLVHWPILTFADYAKLAPLTVLDRLLIVAVSFAAAALMFRFIEQPFRRPNPDRPRLPPARFALACGAGALALIIPALSVWDGGGWAWRLAPDKRALAASTWDHDAPVDGPCRYQQDAPGGAAFEAKFQACLAEAGPAVVILGDSHAGDLFHALASNAAHGHIVGVSQPRCRLHSPGACQNFTRFFEDFIAAHADDIDLLVYNQKASYFLTRDYYAPPLDTAWIEAVATALDRYAALGVETLWVGPRAEMTHEPTATIIPGRDVAGVEARAVWNPHIATVDTALAARAEGAEYGYLSVLDTLGPPKLLAGDAFAYHDPDHWSAAGERVVGRLLIDGDARLSTALGTR